MLGCVPWHGFASEPTRWSTCRDPHLPQTHTPRARAHMFMRVSCPQHTCPSTGRGAELVHAHVLLAVRCRVRVGVRVSFSLTLAPPRHRESARAAPQRNHTLLLMKVRTTLGCNVFRHNTTQHTVLEATQMWAALQALAPALVRTLAVHSPHATRHCSSVARTARIFFAAKTDNPNCDTRTS